MDAAIGEHAAVGAPTRTGSRAGMVAVPELPSPFPDRVNPYALQAQWLALRWARRLGLIRSGEVRALAGQRFGRLAGRCHPGLNPGALADVCRWYLWFALVDDRYCDRPDGADAGRLAGRLAELNQAIDSGVATTAAPLAVAAADLARRTRMQATHEQYRRLVLGFQATFFGLLWERAARHPAAAPAPQEYLAMRPYTGALPAFVTVTEIFSGRPPAPQDVARPEVRALVARVGNLIMWQNDIRSYPWELAAGKPVLSLPTVLDRDGSGGVDAAVRMWHEELTRYRQARAAVLRLAVPALRRYADRLQNLLGGFLAWHYETARYG